MKLQISFDVTDLQKALSKAHQIEKFCDNIEVGTILINKYGIHAIQEFKKAFPEKTILADSKITDRAKINTTIFAEAGADWITVMAGAGKQVIHSVCTNAHNMGMKVMLDLLDASSPGQSAMEAKNLGVDAIIFHRPHDEKDELLFLDDWEMVNGNTELPIFISAKIKRENVDHIINIKPAGIVVGTSIVTAENPKQEAKFYYELVNK
ncbi:orotidine 5'-phosphate decarboxylase [bacterium]|nr:orotidine 5'-phosphate decarboxylase [bacterium]